MALHDHELPRKRHKDASRSGVSGARLGRLTRRAASTCLYDDKFKGLGLGLAVCHSILTAHKGRLWATNRPDGGAAFHFTLPTVTCVDII
jgi:K+-sensing histidine kinase KdpD